MSGFLANFPSDPAFYLVGLATVFIIAVSKGAFGGGLAILGVPLLSLVMPPLDAAIMVAPLVSFMDFFAIGSFGLLRESFNAAMDAVPPSIDQAQVQAFLVGQPGVTAVHHVHIWSLGAGEIAMTAHLVRPDVGDQDRFIDTLNHELDERFGINHPTLQIEHGQACDHDRHVRAPHGGHPHDHDHAHDH